jgi:hypothetical protein
MAQDKITIRIDQRHGAPVAVFDALLVEVLIEDGTGHRVGTNVLRGMLKSHNAVVEALRVAQCEIQKGGTVDRDLVIAQIDSALKLAGA